jgi:hypothetical protein
MRFRKSSYELKITTNVTLTCQRHTRYQIVFSPLIMVSLYLKLKNVDTHVYRYADRMSHLSNPRPLQIVGQNLRDFDLLDSNDFFIMKSL